MMHAVTEVARKRRAVFVLILMGFWAVIYGCATAPSPRAGPPFETPAQNGWWYARYAILWPEGSEPYWYVDLFLAREAIAPVLEKYGSEIRLWRFHRRAARDKAGHQFSFIIYCRPEAALKIFQELSSQPLLKELQQMGFLVDQSYDATQEIRRPGIEDTSDPSWSTATKRAWPYFIMGVSRMWLEAIDHIYREHLTRNRPSTLAERLLLYERVEERLRRLWQEEGGHAVLHHQNAIFGYAPVKVNRVDLFMRF